MGGTALDEVNGLNDAEGNLDGNMESGLAV